MQKILIIFLCVLGFILTSTQSYGADELCGSQSDYPLYECRIKNICEAYTSEKPVYASEEYEPADNATAEFQNQQVSAPALDQAKKTYRKNMGNIYKCGMIQSQRNSLTKLEKFIKKESSGQLSDALGGQIQQKIRKLELSSNTIGCALTDTDTIQNKLGILKETTHELCKYTSYLEYIKSYHEKTKNSATTVHQEQDTNFTVTPRELSDSINKTKNEIAVEISHTYKVFPIAFHAYSEYENNFPIHFLLEVVRGDFLILRKLLHQNLMPLAQLGLKVINAMSY